MLCFKICFGKVLARNSRTQQLHTTAQKDNANKARPAGSRVAEHQCTHHHDYDAYKRQYAKGKAKARRSGAVEKPTMPSIEYLSRPQKFHFVVPATRSTFL